MSNLYKKILESISPLTSKIVEKYVDQTESFYEEEKKQLETTIKAKINITNFTKNKIFGIIFTIFNILLGIYAANISWTVNSLSNWPIILKIIFAIVSFLFAPLYLLLHLIFRYEHLPSSHNVVIKPQYAYGNEGAASLFGAANLPDSLKNTNYKSPYISNTML